MRIGAFHHLRTRLTVLYTALFGTVLMLIAGGVYAAISARARHAIDHELAAGPLSGVLMMAGGLGLAVLALGSLALARTLTRPISALEEAAHRLQRGQEARVAVVSSDEIGRLADSFNAMAREIHERELKITHLALHDPETGLPNRLGFERALETMSRQGGVGIIAVLTLGVDRFEYVRGAIGYALASELVAEIGVRLAGLRPTDHGARLSTDTLGLLVRADDLSDARWIATELMTRLQAPMTLEGQRVDVSLTGGLAIHGIDDAVVGSAIERASIALDQARAGRRKLEVFDEAAYGDPGRNLSLISDMMAALEAGEIQTFHQPKQDLRTGAFTGVETLVRWRHPTRGMVAPDLFVTMAEETGNIRALTEQVLARAIADQASLRERGFDLLFSVNLSGRLLSDPDFAGWALETIRAAEARICFEITETAVIENPKVALGIVDRFAAAGVGVSIDDYGSGLSSLAYLKQIRADELKIDKAFITALADDGRDALLVKSTIDLAHSLGLKVTAEGVETREVRAILAAMGCDLAQGYLMARPLPLAELGDFLEAQQDAGGTAPMSLSA